MDKLKFWFLANQTKILWFVIGWNALDALYSFARGDWGNTVISLALIVLMLAVNR